MTGGTPTSAGAIELRVAETETELGAWRSVRLAVHPHERTGSVAETRDRIAREPERVYLLAYLGGELAGSGFLGRSDLGHAGTAPLVLHAYRGKGIGTAILEALLERARELGYTSAGAHVDGHDERSLAFARRHGFEECDRQVEMIRVLDAAPVPEPPPFDGVGFTTVAQRPELLAQAYDLACEGYADIAFTVSSISVTFEDWVREEATIPEGSFVALAGGEIVGYAGLCAWPDDETRAEHGLTVVRRACRGRGLGTALKARELAWASRNGIRELVTWTQRGNEALQGVNRRLGYDEASVTILVRREPLS